MQSLMKIDSTFVKKLRDDRSWSQEHLATVAGLSLRTVQRVEAEGSAAAETRMAIASAFGVAVAELAPRPPSLESRFRGKPFGVAFGFGGAALGAVLACVGVAHGPNTAAEAGIAYGVIGLAFGLTCSVIGMLSNRYPSKEAADA